MQRIAIFTSHCRVLVVVQCLENCSLIKLLCYETLSVISFHFFINKYNFLFPSFLLSFALSFFLSLFLSSPLPLNPSPLSLSPSLSLTLRRDEDSFFSHFISSTIRIMIPSFDYRSLSTSALYNPVLFLESSLRDGR